MNTVVQEQICTSVANSASKALTSMLTQLNAISREKRDDDDESALAGQEKRDKSSKKRDFDEVGYLLLEHLVYVYVCARACACEPKEI